MMHSSIARCATASVVGAALVHRNSRYRHGNRQPPFGSCLQCASTEMTRQFSIKRSDLISQFNTQSVHKSYEIKGDLGEGGFGSVHIGIDRQTGVKRAIKFMSKKHTTPQAFKIEVEALLELDHPNIVKLIECFEDNKKYYLVQEICTGKDLLDITADTVGFVSERDASIMIRQCIKAVIGCHAHGFIHRDIKLENFMVTSEDKNVKLIDFGLSSRLTDKGTAKGMAGTDVYMAPEMLAAGNKKAYGKSVDVWGLGVTFFSLLSGELFVDIDQHHNVYKDIKKLLADPKFVEKRLNCEALHRRHLSADAMDFLQKLLCQDPDLRITTSEALRHPFILQYVHEDLGSTVGTSDRCDYVDKELAGKIRHFVGLTRLEQVAFFSIAHLAVEGTMGGKLVHMRHVFRTIDSDGDGEISLDELRNYFTENGLATPQDIQEVFAACLNPLQRLTYMEFVAIQLSSQSIAEKLCTAAYMLIDRNHSGDLDEEDLALMCRQNEGCDFENLMREAEMKLRPKEQCKGRLSLEDFHTLIRGAAAVKSEPPRMPKFLNK